MNKSLNAVSATLLMTPSCSAPPLRLSDYQISQTTGFLPATPPLDRLPGDHFGPWERLISRLPELNASRQLRSEVEKLPEREFSQSTLSSEEEWRRAYVLLTLIGQSYIWGEGERGLVDRIPSKIAVPWCAVGEHLSLKPVVCYAATVLYNFSLRDPRGPWDDSDNLVSCNTFTGTEDEDWFYVVPVLIELAAVPGLSAIEKIFEEMTLGYGDGQGEQVSSCLKSVQRSLHNMREELSRMFEKCKPITFYRDIRPFQAGSKGLDVLPSGIVFEGTDDPTPRRYSGASAAQSTAIHVFDVFLGARHSGVEREFLESMRSYMPPKHTGFLRRLEELPSVREYCVRSENPDLFASYNGAVRELEGFRKDHIVMVTRYIVNQLPHSVNASLNAKGSGGTDFMEFLKKVRDETSELIIEDKRS